MTWSVRLLLAAGSVLFIATKGLAGTGHPTIYSTHTINSQSNCAEDEKIAMINDANEVLANLCPRDYRKCLWSGACVGTKEDGSRDTFTYIHFNRDLQRQTFEKVTNGCIYGQGIAVTTAKKRVQTCLDPYFSIAADPSEHFAGEVIFVPKLIGLVLPTGEVHDGYLIVRDSSEDTRDRGHDYYSFFTGLETAENPSNPFLRTMLDNIDYIFDYRTVNDLISEKVRRSRNYPFLPARLQGFYK